MNAAGSRKVADFPPATTIISQDDLKLPKLDKARQAYVNRYYPNGRDGSLLVEVIVNSCVNNQAGSWLAVQEWTTNQKPGQQVDPALDSDYNSKVSAPESQHFIGRSETNGERYSHVCGHGRG